MVINLGEERKKKTHQKDEKVMGEYLNFLSFNELIGEVSKAVNDLNKLPLNKEITVRSKLLMKELGQRINSHGLEKDEHLFKMRNQIENKINDVQKIL